MTQAVEAKKKIKILCISDHPMSPSGVGTQTLNIFRALLKSGKFSVVSLGGAVKHADYKPQKTEEFGDDWIIYPVDGYGNQEVVRSVIRNHRPDLVWFMTDPRFYYWLWQIENEIRPLCPMVYYHVWDNFPYPEFNKSVYVSNDAIVTISKLTSNIVKTVAPEVEELYLPHAVDGEVFQPIDADTLRKFRQTNFSFAKDKFIFFWNNRNARRKQSGTIIYWFKTFLDKVGHDKAMLLMHTDPKDEHGQDLHQIIHKLGLHEDHKVQISFEKIPPGALALIYNTVDATINISDAEGFGLATFESLACETPIVVNMTGGLQEQVTPVEEVTEELMLKRNREADPVTVYEHGVGIEPCSKTVIGSQQVAYIYEDRISEKDFVKALETMYNLSPEERKKMGKAGREHVLKNYNFDNFINTWIEFLEGVHEKHGSWNERKGYKTWELREIKSA